MFEKVKIDIKDLENKKEVKLDDILVVFEDLCLDILDQGDTITNLQIEDLSQVLKSLRSHGRIVLNIASAHPELFEVKYSDRFKDICEKLEAQNQRFEKNTGKNISIMDEIKSDEQIITQIRKKIDMLEKEADNIQLNIQNNCKKLMKIEEE